MSPSVLTAPARPVFTRALADAGALADGVTGTVGGGGSAAPQFIANWSTGTGQSLTALQDGGLFNYIDSNWGVGNPYRGEVVSASGLGFPAGLANVFSFGMTPSSTPPKDSRGGVAVSGASTGIPVPAIGETTFHRFYFRNAIRDAVPGGANAHFFQGWDTGTTLNPAGSSPSQHWWYKFGSRADGRFPWRLEWQRSSELGGDNWEALIEPFSPLAVTDLLLKNTTYLIEVAYTRTGANAFTITTRIDAAGTDVRYHTFAPTGSSFIPLSTRNTNVRLDPETLRTCWIGNNDPGPTFTGADPELDKLYVGAVAIAVRSSATDWIGAFESGRGW